MSRGIFRRQTVTAIDTRAEMEVISRVSWRILYFSDKSKSLGRALKGMGTKVLLSVDTVTMVEDSEERVVLL